MRHAPALALALALALAGCNGSTPNLDASTADTSAGQDAGDGSDTANSAADASADTAYPLGCGDWAGRTPIRVLFTGNSQIEWNGLHSVVARLSQSAPAACPRIEEVTHIFTPSLEALLDAGEDSGRRFSEALTSGAYDVVVLTESIDIAELPDYGPTFRSSASALVTNVRAAGAVPVLYATGYIETPTRFGFTEMAAPQLELGRELGVHVAAGGLAWLRLWEARPEVDLFDPDRFHPGHRGAYLSAAVLYAAITGASPVGLTRDPGVLCQYNPCAPVEDELVPLLQELAWAQHQATGR